MVGMVTMVTNTTLQVIMWGNGTATSQSVSLSGWELWCLQDHRI